VTIQVGTTDHPPNQFVVDSDTSGGKSPKDTKKKAVEYTNSPLKSEQLSAKRYLKYLLAQDEVWTQPRPIYRPRVERLIHQVQSVEEAHQVGGGES
jgi:hypothetical protein